MGGWLVGARGLLGHLGTAPNALGHGAHLPQLSPRAARGPGWECYSRLGDRVRC